MFQPGDDDLVILADVLAPPALGNQVDPLGSAAHEDDFAGRRGVEEAADLFAGGLVGIRGPGRQFMRRAVDVGILVSVEVTEAVDDALRLLGGRGIIQPDQRPAVHALPQNRKIPPDGLHVEDLRREVHARGLRVTGSSAGTGPGAWADKKTAAGLPPERRRPGTRIRAPRGCPEPSARAALAA